ncbi:MAG: hypothetical protein RR385_09965, partial [Clostridiales bacterium]
GKVEPGQEKLTILGLTLGVSEVWLMGYDVSMERDTYNWDIDEEYRLSSIPPNEWDSLLSKHNGSKQRAWEEWWDICAQLFLDGLSAKFNHGEPLEEMTNMETIAILNEDEEKRELNHSQIKQLITSFRSLDEEGKNKVLSYIEDIAPKHKTDK